MVVVTKKLINSGLSCRGGLSRIQCSLLGVPFPLVKGWKKSVIGTEISDSFAERFQALRCAHCKHHRSPLSGGTIHFFLKEDGTPVLSLRFEPEP